MNQTSSASATLAQAMHPRSGGEWHLPVRTAYTALAWVVVFFAFHIYWYLGGSFASPGSSVASPDLLPHSLVRWISGVLMGAAWPLGAWVCLAIARGWPRGRMRRAALIVVWLGCTVLVLRGGAGLIDDLTRALGPLPNGITGLSHKQTMGPAYYRSASVLWSNNIIDAYFLAGGLLFGVLAHRYRPPRSVARRGVPPLSPADWEDRALATGASRGIGLAIVRALRRGPVLHRPQTGRGQASPRRTAASSASSHGASET